MFRGAPMRWLCATTPRNWSPKKGQYSIRSRDSCLDSADEVPDPQSVGCDEDDAYVAVAGLIRLGGQSAEMQFEPLSDSMRALCRTWAWSQPELVPENRTGV